MTPSEFRAGMDLLSVTFGRDLSPALLEVYRAQFGGWSAEAWAHVVNRACGDLRFFPKPVELKEMAAVSRGDAVERAWGVVEGALRTVGRYRSVDFGPAVNAAIRHLGGWQKICECSTDELHFRQQAFAKALDLYTRGAVSPELACALPGLEEVDAVKHGKIPAPPVNLTAKIAGARRALTSGVRPQLVAGGEAA